MSDNDVIFSFLAFGTHLSPRFGKTLNNILDDGFPVSYKIETLSEFDTPNGISHSMGKTIEKFSDIWSSEQFDLVIALGDRYEMFAAVASTVPFNIPVAHLHGGETTLGAIDNALRHSITCMAKYHFVSTQEYYNRVSEITGNAENIYNVGALSIDALKDTNFLSTEEFHSKYGIDILKPTILITFHPETIEFEENKNYVEELISALRELNNYQQIITMPNADTMGIVIRTKLLEYAQDKPNVFCVESFGSLGYLSCMKYCIFMLGNTSSGFVEAAFFCKPVVNIGKRQKGRIETPNIITVPILKQDILNGVSLALALKINISNCQIYGNGKAAEQILQILKSKYNEYV